MNRSRSFRAETGVTTLFHSFVKHLEKEKDKFSLLQLTGRLEDCLLHEFIYHVHQRSNGARLAITNVGNRGQQVIDIAILSGNLDGELQIEALIEGKYFRNRHRAWSNNAADETLPNLRKLWEQLGKVKANHGGFPVKLRARSHSIYGLVFASCVVDKENEDQNEKESFFKKQIEKASQFARYYDLQKPYFDRVYDDVEVNILGGTRLVSLRAGLWRKKE
jgi:hypothetical protein